MVKRYLSQKAAVRTAVSTPHGLTPEQRTAAAQWSQHLVSFIEEAKLDVEGDLAEVYPAPTPSRAPTPFDNAAPTQEADIAVRLTGSLVQWMAQQESDRSSEPVHEMTTLDQIRGRLRGMGVRATSNR